MKTGTVMRAAQADMERRSNSEGSRPGPVPGATIWGPTRDDRLSDCSWRAWSARHVDEDPPDGGQLGVDLVVRPSGWPTPDTGVEASGASVPVGQRGGRLGVVDALGDPAGGEPVVVDAAGVAGGEEVVGGAHRGDGGQVGRVGAGRGQLGQARVADAHHAHLVVGHPGLVGHDLDGVVGVVVRRVAEEVEGPARAARCPASAG